MAAIVLALLVAVGYLEAANQHGTARVPLLYPPKVEAFQADIGPPPLPAPLHVWGVPVARRD